MVVDDVVKSRGMVGSEKKLDWKLMVNGMSDQLDKRRRTSM